MKIKFQNLKFHSLRVVGALAAATALVQTNAQAATTGPDFTVLTSGIDFSTVTVGILAVAATLIGVYVAIKGAKILIGMVRGA
jgi:hypothetical protein